MHLMHHRITASLLLLALLVSFAEADALLVRGRGGKLEVVGMPSDIEGEPVTTGNWKIFVDQSTGVISRDGYDGVDLLKRANDKKGTTYAAEDIVEKIYTTQPEALLDAYDSQSRGNLAQAIGEFRAVADSADVSDVYRIEASYMTGIVYLQMNNRANAMAHFAKWPGRNSIYTPEVYRIMAEVHTEQKAFDKARASYEQIGALPDISRPWKLKARLGPVKVDIAERRFDAAEATAKSVAGEAAGAESLNDARALAITLQAEAIFASANKDRLPEAQKLLEGASNFTGVAAVNRAYLFSTLGNIVYAQGKPEEATYPYMRVVCLFPDTSYVPSALQNAGQCLLDMAERTKDNQATSDEYLVQGMKLLAECAGRHKGTAPAAAAGSSYMKNKSWFEEAQRRSGDGTESGK